MNPRIFLVFEEVYLFKLYFFAFLRNKFSYILRDFDEIDITNISQ
jgi:hypothetical protein